MFVSPEMVHKDKPCNSALEPGSAIPGLVDWALWKSPGVLSQVEPEHLGRSTLCMTAQRKIAEIHLFWEDVLLWLGSSRANISLNWYVFLGCSQDVCVFPLVCCTPGGCCTCGPRCDLSAWPVFSLYPSLLLYVPSKLYYLAMVGLHSSIPLFVELGCVSVCAVKSHFPVCVLYWNLRIPLGCV